MENIIVNRAIVNLTCMGIYDTISLSISISKKDLSKILNISLDTAEKIINLARENCELKSNPMELSILTFFKKIIPPSNIIIRLRDGTLHNILDNRIDNTIPCHFGDKKDNVCAFCNEICDLEDHHISYAFDIRVTLCQNHHIKAHSNVNSILHPIDTKQIIYVFK